MWYRHCGNALAAVRKPNRVCPGQTQGYDEAAEGLNEMVNSWNMKATANDKSAMKLMFIPIIGVALINYFYRYIVLTL